jgi:hypothetical protein
MPTYPTIVGREFKPFDCQIGGFVVATSTASSRSLIEARRSRAGEGFLVHLIGKVHREQPIRLGDEQRGLTLTHSPATTRAVRLHE